MWQRISFKAVTIAISLFGIVHANAVVVNWDTLTWTPGTFSNSYDVDPGNSGNDITVAVTFSDNRFTTDPATGLDSPSINNSLSGGLSPAENNLKFVVDYSTNLETITLNISFAAFYPQGVQNVSFSLFDIDMDFGGPINKWQDQILSISATNGVTTFAPTITNVGSSVTLSGTGVNQVLTANNIVPDSGAGSSAGNATIGFGSNAITSLTFTFAAGPASNNNPDVQYFGLHDLSYVPVPEMSSVSLAAVGCIVLVLWVRLTRRRLSVPTSPRGARARAKD